MRGADVFLSATLLAVCALPMAVIALWVKSGSPGGAFYRQERLGRGEKPFTLHKFRTMREGAEPYGPQLSFRGDPRVTKAGRVLRRYHLDELPQLWNVLRGDMSLIGPRPERGYYAGLLKKEVEGYERIFRVRPGLSSPGVLACGYASTLGEMAERSRHDLEYADRPTAREYLHLLVETVKAVARGEGV